MPQLKGLAEVARRAAERRAAEGQPIIRRFDFVNGDDLRAGVYITYPKSVSKGDAWKHLLANPPLVEHRGQLWTPCTAPKGRNSDHPYNPYRKAHEDEYWAWYVNEWRQGSPVVRPKTLKPRRVRRSRYELIVDDEWLGVQDPS